jgi:hypothetical protein
MASLSEEEFRKLLREWRDSIRSSVDQIRNAEDDVLLILTDQDQMQRAIIFMTGVIGRQGISMTSNTTNIGTAGVAVTGGTSYGDITGNVQQNMSAEVSKALAEIEQLRQKLLTSPALSEDQKKDNDVAVQDIHAEFQKVPTERNQSRIRMALNMLASSVKLVDGAQHVYDSLAPHVMNLIHHF